MSHKAISWSGVFPAVSTQFRSDFSLDLDATHTVIKNLVKDGVSGLVVCGTVGENTSLTVQEKLSVIEVARDAAQGQVPVIAGIAEFTTAFARNMAREAQKVGVDGIMVMPALVYSAKPHETATHFRSVATATDLPIMVYNNPPIYKNDVTPDILTSLVDCENIVCFKDSSGDTRRFIDLRNEVGDRFVLFAGLDDVVLESIAVGAEGWISGMSNAFPREGETLFRLAKQKRFEEALALYSWFMPLLHLDARPDLVQCIKLCEELVGRGSAIAVRHVWHCRAIPWPRSPQWSKKRWPTALRCRMSASDRLPRPAACRALSLTQRGNPCPTPIPLAANSLSAVNAVPAVRPSLSACAPTTACRPATFFSRPVTKKPPPPPMPPHKHSRPILSSAPSVEPTFLRPLPTN